MEPQVVALVVHISDQVLAPVKPACRLRIGLSSGMAPASLGRHYSLRM